MIVGFHGRASEAPDICAIGAYLKPIDLALKGKMKTLDHHDQNKKSCKPSKLSDVFVPALGNPSKPLHQARHPSRKILRNNHDDDQYNKQLLCGLAGNQVMGKEVDQNGGFAVGNTYISHYYYSESFNNAM